MLTNELLEMKDRAQRALALQSGDDLQAYAHNVHQIVREVEQQLGLKFRYRRAAQKTASPPTTLVQSSDQKPAA
jgi:hypothetical protein